MLRGTHGPHAGSMYVIEGAMIVGRSPHADIQIVEEGVSRQHARIRVEPDGRVVIADLQSGQGTKVGGRRIDTKDLRPGETIQIGEARFVYETRSGAAITSPSFVNKSRSAAALHRTNPGVSRDPTPAPGIQAAAAGVYQPGSGGAVPAVRPEGPPPPPRPPARAAPSTPVASPRHHPVGHGLTSGAPRAPIGWDEQAAGDEGPGLPTVDVDHGLSELATLFADPSATDPAGRFSLQHEPMGEVPPAPGPRISGPEFSVLMQRLVHYHALAAQLTRDEPIDDTTRQTLVGYEMQFRQDAELAEDRRKWRRFAVQAAANVVWFRDLRSRSIVIQLLDIGASGVCFESGERVFDIGDVISLLVSLPDEGRQAVFSGRITWVSPDRDRCGATFVGPGSWQPQ